MCSGLTHVENASLLKDTGRSLPIRSLMRPMLLLRKCLDVDENVVGEGGGEYPICEVELARANGEGLRVRESILFSVPEE